MRRGRNSMLVVSTFEKTPAEYAWQMAADRLSDNVRNTWLDFTQRGIRQWEEMYSEDVNALPGLREEGFDGLVGLDYIFKWRGPKEDDPYCGEIDVIWKILRSEQDGVSCYRTRLKVDEQDFIRGLHKDERDKREASRADFRDAFAQWKENYRKL